MSEIDDEITTLQTQVDELKKALEVAHKVFGIESDKLGQLVKSSEARVLELSHHLSRMLECEDVEQDVWIKADQALQNISPVENRLVALEKVCWRILHNPEARIGGDIRGELNACLRSEEMGG